MRLIVLLCLGAMWAVAQPGFTVQNAASFQQGQAAPGSLIVLSNALVDPSVAVVTIQPAGSAMPVRVPLIQGWIARLPEDLPLGAATLQVSGAGQRFGPVTLTIVPSSFGLLTSNGGRGPVLAQNSLTHPAKPGDYVTLWGTGLGSALQDQVSVLLGGHAARVTYAGPAPGYPGTDQINFQVVEDPAVPFGCYVAISVSAGGVFSNTATLSTSVDGAPCQSPLGFSPEQLAQLDAGQSLAVGQVSLYDMVGHAQLEWFMATDFTRMESAQAFFLSLSAANMAVLLDPLRADDAYYGCYQVSGVTAGFLSSGGAISVGTSMTLSNGSKSIDFPYQVQIPNPPMVPTPDAVTAPFFSPGIWTVTIPGSVEVMPATGTLNVPPPLRITNASALPTIDRTHDLTVTWNGTDYTPGYTATLQVNGSTTVICRTPGDAGTMTVPAALLGKMSPQAGSLELLLVPRAGRITTFPVALTNVETMPVLFRYFPSEALQVGIQ